MKRIKSQSNVAHSNDGVLIIVYSAALKDISPTKMLILFLRIMHEYLLIHDAQFQKNSSADSRKLL